MKSRLACLWKASALYNKEIPIQSTLTLQKSRMLQIQGIEGEAVVIYREPSITKEMRYPRLSRRVKIMTNFLNSWNSPVVNS